MKPIRLYFLNDISKGKYLNLKLTEKVYSKYRMDKYNTTFAHKKLSND